ASRPARPRKPCARGSRLRSCSSTARGGRASAGAPHSRRRPWSSCATSRSSPEDGASILDAVHLEAPLALDRGAEPRHPLAWPLHITSPLGSLKFLNPWVLS